MFRGIKIPDALSFERMKPAFVTGLVIFATGLAVDLGLDGLGWPAAARVVGHLIIGLLGALMLLLYLSSSYQTQQLAQAKEKMRLVAELNESIRKALSLVGTSAVTEDREKRLQIVDQAVWQIDELLTHLPERLAKAQTGRVH